MHRLRLAGLTAACNTRQYQWRITILRAIKAKSPSTKTFACKRGNTLVVRSRKVDEKPLCADCGQFDGIVAAYDAQLKVVTDKAYSGFYLHGDDGKPIGGDTPGIPCSAKLDK